MQAGSWCIGATLKCKTYGRFCAERLGDPRAREPDSGPFAPMGTLVHHHWHAHPPPFAPSPRLQPIACRSIAHLQWESRHRRRAGMLGKGGPTACHRASAASAPTLQRHPARHTEPFLAPMPAIKIKDHPRHKIGCIGLHLFGFQDAGAASPSAGPRHARTQAAAGIRSGGRPRHDK